MCAYIYTIFVCILLCIQVSRLKEIITELRQELSVKRQEITDLKTIHAEELTSTKNTLEKQVCDLDIILNS